MNKDLNRLLPDSVLLLGLGLLSLLPFQAQSLTLSENLPDMIKKGSPGVANKSLTLSENLPDMIEKVSPGVANISSTRVTNYRVYGMDDFFRLWGIPQSSKQTALGSGFIIDEQGLMLTNNHVVQEATEVIVTLVDKRQFSAKILGKDEKMDLALLQIKDNKSNSSSSKSSHFTPVPMGNSDLVRIGDTVVVAGNPFGLQNTVTRGIISAKNRTIGLGPFDNFLQTDASINPGNSPLFNIKGEVIGISIAIRSDTGQSSGLGFAIPINAAKMLIPDLKRYGRVPRSWLGILAQRMTPQLADSYELETHTGVLIYTLIEDAPADLAGLQQGDILVSLNEIEIAEPDDLEKALFTVKPRTTISVKVYRGKKKQTFQIKLAELPRLEHLPKGIM